MRFYSLGSSPFKPVSHDPALKKQVLVPDAVSCVKHISHIRLKPGDKATVHSHADAYEVFYCALGEVVFILSGKEVVLKKGDCLVVEPCEEHEIFDVAEETELLYFHAAK